METAGPSGDRPRSRVDADLGADSREVRWSPERRALLGMQRQKTWKWSLIFGSEGFALHQDSRSIRLPGFRQPPSPRHGVPTQSGEDQSNADLPGPRIDLEGEEQARRQPDNLNDLRVATLFRRLFQGREVGDRIIDQHGEGAEGPGQLHVAEEREDADDYGDADDAVLGRMVFRIDVSKGCRRIRPTPHGQEDAG